MAGGNKTIYLPKKHLKYVVDEIPDFSLYVRGKIEEDMENNVSHLQKKVKDIEVQKSLLEDRIEKLKKVEEDRKQRLEKLIKKAEGRTGGALEKWAKGWSAEIAKCGMSVDKFIEIAQERAIVETEPQTV